jgi:hypothetical protein
MALPGFALSSFCLLVVVTDRARDLDGGTALIPQQLERVLRPVADLGGEAHNHRQRVRRQGEGGARGAELFRKP